MKKIVLWFLTTCQCEFLAKCLTLAAIMAVAGVAYNQLFAAGKVCNRECKDCDFFGPWGKKTCFGHRILDEATSSWVALPSCITGAWVDMGDDESECADSGFDRLTWDFPACSDVCTPVAGTAQKISGGDESLGAKTDLYICRKKTT
jgi:hypothetical protein